MLEKIDIEQLTQKFSSSYTNTFSENAKLFSDLYSLKTHKTFKNDKEPSISSTKSYIYCYTKLCATLASHLKSAPSPIQTQITNTIIPNLKFLDSLITSYTLLLTTNSTPQLTPSSSLTLLTLEYLLIISFYTLNSPKHPKSHLQIPKSHLATLLLTCDDLQILKITVQILQFHPVTVRILDGLLRVATFGNGEGGTENLDTSVQQALIEILLSSSRDIVDK